MKKFLGKCLALMIAASFIISSAACSNSGSASASNSAELALVTDLGTIDDKSFNQGAWEGLVQYATEKNKTHKYYQPTEQSDDSYLNTIDLAVQGGAKLVVTPGFLFEVPIFIAQERYPDVKFILVDGNPHDADYNYSTKSNAVGVTYAEEQAGFLAGYAAVKDGYTQLGYMGGMAVPAVVRYGYGFVQGADYAGKELGLGAGAIKVNYHYTGGFVATPEAQAMAASWYSSGIEVIFAAGGAVGNSVMAAAEAANAKVIGVDVDQSSESPTVITSALKGLKASVYDCVKSYDAGSFPGGEAKVYSAANYGVGLELSNAKFQKFSEADYNAIFEKLYSNSVTIVKDTDAAGAAVELANVPAETAVVTEVK
ncbi:MAG: BMP family ABC transporter substrate-binding protein [Clostridiales bacterium]|nr:BMP family ABC transporter substrate-binding protein [Clostridiales bacterium]